MSHAKLEPTIHHELYKPYQNLVSFIDEHGDSNLLSSLETLIDSVLRSEKLAEGVSDLDEAIFLLKENSFRFERPDARIEKIHEEGRASHGFLWLRANEAAIAACRAQGLEPSEAKYPQIISAVVLAVLDKAKRVKRDDPRSRVRK